MLTYPHDGLVGLRFKYNNKIEKIKSVTGGIWTQATYTQSKLCTIKLHEYLVSTSYVPC